MNTKDYKKIIQSAAIFLILFLILVINGRFLMNSNSQSSSPVSTTSQETAQQTVTTQPTQLSTSSSQTTLQTCVENLQTTIKANKTEYQAGTVLVRFSSAIDFSTAKTIVGIFHASVDSQSDQNAYASNHLIIADVPQGKEFETICEMRQDSRIQYANINPLFMLHE